MQDHDGAGLGFGFAYHYYTIRLLNIEYFSQSRPIFYLGSWLTMVQIKSKRPVTTTSHIVSQFLSDGN